MVTVGRVRRQWTAVAFMSYFGPLAVAGGLWYYLTNFSSYNNGQITTIIAGLLLTLYFLAFWWVYRTVSLPVEEIYKHLESISNQEFNHRTIKRFGGLLGRVTIALNQLSDQLQELATHNQAEMAVIAAEAHRLRNVLNSINDGVIALDSQAHVILFNRAASKISGFTLEEAAGQPVSQILPLLRGNSLVLNEWLTSCEGSDIQSRRWEALRLKTKDGKTRSLDIEALYQGADPNGIRTLITFHDRTAEQEIEDMKVDFVSLAAHELRTPITVIRGYLEILETELGDKLTPEHLEFMRKLNLSASQLSGFINNILHVSRIEHGNLNLKFEPTDWIDLIKNTCQELANRASMQGKKLVLNLPERLPPVAVDRISIVEVINNLVDNAIKYSDPQTTIMVNVKQNGDSVETVVQDQGIGIPENAIDKLFTKFYRSHRTKASHRGTGLGLYMSKAVVEAHGGTIWVHSIEGQGSTFGFLLPTYDKMSHSHLAVDESNKIIRGVHGWIKNHSLYRG